MRRVHVPLDGLKIESMVSRRGMRPHRSPTLPVIPELRSGAERPAFRIQGFAPPSRDDAEGFTMPKGKMPKSKMPKGKMPKGKML